MIFRSSADPERLETKMPQWQIGNLPSQAKDKRPAALRGRATTYTKRTFIFAPRAISTEPHLTLGFTTELGTLTFENPPRVRAEVLQAFFYSCKMMSGFAILRDGCVASHIAESRQNRDIAKIAVLDLHSDVSRNV